MSIDELIDRLEAYRDELGGEIDVRLMTRKNWPFENAIQGVVSASEIQNDEEDEEGIAPFGDADDAVYLVEGRQLGYGAKVAWRICE